MTRYQAFHEDLTQRCSELHEKYLEIAKTEKREVTYLLMRLGCAFILPYERVVLDNKLGPSKKDKRSEIRRDLEINKKFIESDYCDNGIEWTYLKMDENKFYEGYESEEWSENETDLGEKLTGQVLGYLRNAVAHSNLLFACDESNDTIVRIYFGTKETKKNEKMKLREPTGKYHVIGCDLRGLDRLLDVWSKKLGGLGSYSYKGVLKALEEAA